MAVVLDFVGCERARPYGVADDPGLSPITDLLADSPALDYSTAGAGQEGLILSDDDVCAD
jgi:hypothetical protein